MTKGGSHLAFTVLVIAVAVLAQNVNISEVRYHNELPQYRFYATAKWRTLVPARSTMADVRRLLGEPDEANDMATYTLPYPGDAVAKDTRRLEPHFVWAAIIFEDTQE